MTEKTHQHFGYTWAICLALVMQPLWGWLGIVALFIGVTPGSTAPDWLECRGIIRHRTITHLPWLWAALLCFGVTRIDLLEPTNMAACALIGFSLGALSHWVGDLGTPFGVPLVLPNQRVSIGLWKTGNPSEKWPLFVAWLIIAALVAARFSMPPTQWLEYGQQLMAQGQWLASSAVWLYSQLKLHLQL